MSINTFNNSTSESLTMDDIKKAIELVNSIPKRKVYYISHPTIPIDKDDQLNILMTETLCKNMLLIFNDALEDKILTILKNNGYNPINFKDAPTTVKLSELKLYMEKDKA